MRLVFLLVLTLGGIWAAAVLVLSLENAGPKMPAATPFYESRAALAKLSHPLKCATLADATLAHGIHLDRLGKPRCYFRKEPHGQ